MEDRMNAYISRLKENFSGDIDVSESTKEIYSTDNSIYKIQPTVVLFPKNVDDVCAIFLNLDQDSSDIKITARGGGTGTNGQSLNKGVIVDLSRYMNKILNIDYQNNTATVQAGVVKDQLNSIIENKNLFFAPELSTSNRATIGGMINTDASGQGSCRYGKTNEHVIELKTVLTNGEIIVTSLKNYEAFEIEEKSAFEKKIYKELYSLAINNKKTINNNFPKLNRSLTGYDLPRLLIDNKININNILCGSEGTLGIIVEAKIKLTKKMKFRSLINIGYNNFIGSLKDAELLMVQNPLSIETVDSKILELARSDIIWNDVSRFFETNYEDNIKGVNIVEIDSNDYDDLKNKEKKIMDIVKCSINSNVVSISVADNENDIINIYAMRKKAVGLLGKIKGHARPQPFVEDTAVPPEHLAKYIVQFRKLLDSMNLDYGMFGHVDAGVLHVRPILDMKDEESLMKIRYISDEVSELTKNYGGVIWGEHGKGLRSEYAPKFFGDAYPLIQKVKSLFDPENILNPGKIATPLEKLDSKLIKLDEVETRGTKDKLLKAEDWEKYGNTLHCNGNGACFNYDYNEKMCPSYKVTRDRKQSPKGRATLIKEWLIRENTNRSSQEFDKQVLESFKGCLSCKSCTTQCPINVDIPQAKSIFYEAYYKRNTRKLRDYLVSYLEINIVKFLKIKILFNLILRNSYFKSIMRDKLNLIDLPVFHSESNVNFEKYGAKLLKVKNIDKINFNESSVIIIQDAFTSFYKTDILISTIQVLKKLSFDVYVLEYLPNGKPFHVNGFLDKFNEIKNNNIKVFEKIYFRKVHMVGIDPAMTIVYRQEYKTDKISNFNIQLLQEFLSQNLTNFENLYIKNLEKVDYKLFTHCTEITQVPNSYNLWKLIFDKLDVNLSTEKTGCCGMSGTYGHEFENYENSKQIFNLSWNDKIDKNLLVTGYSCNSQIQRLKNIDVKHPIEILNKLI